jgi:WhiB family transcriptional regulator, redox-sensing transcriptional regulator
MSSGWGAVTKGKESAVHELKLITELGDPEDVGDEGELGWQERALCAQTDPEAFFPEKGGSTREAKKVCIGCDVRGECLEYALANDERFGIWGGLSERERRKLKKRAV